MPDSQRETARIVWTDGGVPSSERFDEAYFSLENGLAETNHVFLAGNGLPKRYRDGFHIAELGFGSGLNMLAALRMWLNSGVKGHLIFTSFEAFPMAADDMRRSLEGFPELAELTQELLNKWSVKTGQFQIGPLTANIIIGDARETLPKWRGLADAWFLDGFSPAKNPQMWTHELMRQVTDHTPPQGTFATFTAAGHVRAKLRDVGFEVEKVNGFGRKRHMSTGILKARHGPK